MYQVIHHIAHLTPNEFHFSNEKIQIQGYFWTNQGKKLRFKVAFLWCLLQSYSREHFFNQIVSNKYLLELHLSQPHHSKICILGMTLNHIWQWGFSPGDLGSVEYSFIAITPRFNLTWSSCYSKIHQISSDSST